MKTTKTIAAGLLAVLALAACNRDTRPPEQPSPGSPPKPSVQALPAMQAAYAFAPDAVESTAVVAAPFGAPGVLPAAERHFQIYRQLRGEHVPFVEAHYAPDKGERIN